MEQGPGKQPGVPMPYQQESQLGQQDVMGQQARTSQQAAISSQRGSSHAQVRAAAPRFEPLEVEEVARSEVVTATPDDTVAEIVSKMGDEDVGSVVVVEDDQPVGIVTDRKIALSLGETGDVTDMTADELTTADLVIGRTDMTVFDAAELLRDEGIRRLPLVDEDGQLEGIVTLDDILVLLAGKFGVAAEIIETQAPGR